VKAARPFMATSIEVKSIAHACKDSACPAGGSASRLHHIRGGDHGSFWHIRDIARSQIEVRFRCKSGHTADITAMTGFDPFETYAVQDFRSAKVLFVPSLSVISFLLLHAHDLRRERSMAMHIRRREFIFTLGGAAAALPLAARAQQAAMPIVGFLRSATLADAAHLVTAFRQGLKESGFVEGQNIAVEYRSAEGQPGCRFAW
jgi:hypothetical protein